MDLDEYRRRRYQQRYGPLADRALARNQEQTDLIRRFNTGYGMIARWSSAVREEFVREWESIERRYSDLPPIDVGIYQSDNVEGFGRQ